MSVIGGLVYFLLIHGVERVEKCYKQAVIVGQQTHKQKFKHSQRESVSGSPELHVCRLWEGARAPGGGNTHTHPRARAHTQA